MTCKSCRQKFPEDSACCPNCGETNPEVAGVFQTSVVLISVGGADLTYRSVSDVPDGLRAQLLKSTNGANSATILIADRRGRKEAAKAMRKLPAPVRRRMMDTVLGERAASAAALWFTPRRKKVALAIIVILTMALLAFLFGHRWI